MRELIVSRGQIQEIVCICGRCHDYVCPRGFCWCKDNRDPIAGLSNQFPSPVIDQSDPSMWREEVDILRVLFDAGATAEGHMNSPLTEGRGYMADIDTYGIYWYWTNRGTYHNPVSDQSTTRPFETRWGRR